MNRDSSRNSSGLVMTALFAGLAGGAAEILWAGAYAAATPLHVADVGREITMSLWPAFAAHAAAPWFGAALHLALSCVLAGAFVWAVRRPLARAGAAAVWATSLAVLAAVWALNFLVLLPVLNPAFVDLMPYPATLVSKLLFGAAMAAVLVARGNAVTARSGTSEYNGTLIGSAIRARRA